MNFEQYFISTRRMAGKALATIIGIEHAIKEGHTVLLASQTVRALSLSLMTVGM
jgi:hypothetical protein